MQHKQIISECEGLGLTVRQVPDSGRKSFEATAPKVRVYWSTSDLGGMLGLPRVISNGVDTHARTIKEIAYLVKRV